MFGLTAIFMAFVSKKINLFIWGILFIFAFWINMFLLFSVLPILGN
ncbi:putative membrane protein [Streptococcus pyogenes SS1447]|nr:putative membrane protein [Streptococcus pyogenes AA216]KGE58269.1 putative membrane protein [Streptococcus pyogenes SS1447]SDV86803.1 Phage protein [Streptococcus pyogenes]